MLTYLAAIDYQNLDNPLFLKSFAEAAKQVKIKRAVIVHADSDYTERLIQTGMMRGDAVKRSMQDLNHRLVSFFADFGLACIGINGFQRGTVRLSSEGELTVDKAFMQRLPEGTVTVLSALVKGPDGEPVAVRLSELLHAVRQQLNAEQTCIFTLDAADQIITKSHNNPEIELTFSQIMGSSLSDKIPSEFIDHPVESTLCKPLINNSLNKFSSLAKIINNA